MCICFLAFKEMRQIKGGRGPCSEGIACRCNFSFHKWKNCSIDFSHIILLFIVVKKKSIKEKLSFNLSGEGIFMQPAKVCYIILDSRRLFSWDTMASWSLSRGSLLEGSPDMRSRIGTACQRSQWGPHSHAQGTKRLHFSTMSNLSSFSLSIPGLFLPI